MSKVASVALAALLLISITVNLFPSHIKALSGQAIWERVNIPSAGDSGGWILAPGSDVKHLTMAKDGTLFAYANPTGASSRLFRSKDSGSAWESVGNVQAAITGIAVSPTDANVLYYSTSSSVFRSADGGKTFVLLPPNPGGAGAGNIAITSVAISNAGNQNIVAVGTADADNMQFGGVYILDESRVIPAWENTAIGNQDVRAVAFSPHYAADRQIIAVSTNETNTFVSAKFSSGAWDGIFGKAVISGIVAQTAAIAFPDDYESTSGQYILFVGLNGGGNSGDVYRINGRMAPDASEATDLNAGAPYGLGNADITGLAVSGNASAAYLLAGGAVNARLFISSDGGKNWIKARKNPTGGAETFILLAANFTSSRTVFASTSGADSAFSHSADGGSVWNQTGLIDTRISANGILDVAASPGFEQDNIIFLLTFDSVSLEHSLWRGSNGGQQWERVFGGTQPNVDTLKFVDLSPSYGQTGFAVYLAGTSGGSPALWRSADNGQTFTLRSAPSAIDVWTITGDDHLLFGSYNGTHSNIYSTENGGFIFSALSASGTLPLKSIVVSPDYEKDGAILTGNSNGWVYLSSDNGALFKPLPTDATAPPLSAGTVNVAFDQNFAENRTVYASTNTASKGVYRFVLGKSIAWERLDATLPASGTIVGLAVAGSGALYAVNSQAADAAAVKGGMERSLNPSLAQGAAFETVLRGLDDGAKLSGIALSGSSRIWAIDTQNTRLLTFADSLAQPVILTSPHGNDVGIERNNAILRWETLPGATEYRWQVDYDNDFTAVPAGFEGDTAAGSVKAPELAANTAYYWRVRATKPVLGQWSGKRSFTTGLGAAGAGPELQVPKAGAESVSAMPLFQWNSVPGAAGYELLVATDNTFSAPLVAKTGKDALPATAWQSDVGLEVGRVYYWKVRAVGVENISAWSAVSAFVTESPPPVASNSNGTSAPKEPSSIPQSLVSPAPQDKEAAQPVIVRTELSLPGWFSYMVGGFMLVIVLLLTVILVLVISRRRY